jgi:hypothetical protein
VEHKDLVALISTEATQEAALEGMLDKVSGVFTERKKDSILKRNAYGV